MSDFDKPFPDIPAALLEYLERCFPDRFPDPKLPERELWMKGGEVRLVRLLRHRFDQQNGGARRR